MTHTRGPPKTFTTQDDMTKVHDLILRNRRLKVLEKVATVGISKDRTTEQQMQL